jgi:hypothetical protein
LQPVVRQAAHSHRRISRRRFAFRLMRQNALG